MVTFSQADYLNKDAKLKRDRTRADHAEMCAGEPVEREKDLASAIVDHCFHHGYMFIRARSDRASTIAIGHPDMTIFCP